MRLIDNLLKRREVDKMFTNQSSSGKLKCIALVADCLMNNSAQLWVRSANSQLKVS
jgi:hypothetical protein